MGFGLLWFPLSYMEPNIALQLRKGKERIGFVNYNHNEKACPLSAATSLYSIYYCTGKRTGL